MNTDITLDELRLFELWAEGNNSPEIEIALRAIKHLRTLMDKDLSRKQILDYLHQQMGIIPKSERGRSLSSKQSGESAIPGYLCPR